MNPETVIIVGAGQAGGWAARTLRSEGFAGRVVLSGDEASPPYERPPLSKEQLQPEAPAMPYLIGEAELATLGIEWRGSASVTRIDRSTRTVVLGAGETIGYDKLILCTGGRARMPAIAGIDLPCVHSLRTLDDARRLRSLLASGKRVLVMGGGWIGLEVAASARRLGCTVTVAEAGATLCARSGSAILSGYLARLHTANGVRLRMNTSITSLEALADGGCRALCADGATLDADLVVVGIGLVQNDALARDAGLACERGVIVDYQCRTSDPFIYAAGDVTAMAAPGGSLMRLESWQNAQDQAIAAARAALGQQVHYEPLPFFWSQQYHAMVQIAGACSPDHQALTRDAHTDNFQYVEMGPDGQVRAAVCANSARNFRQLRQFIASGTRIDASRFMDASIPLAKTVLTEPA
jgi:3-phenylpropionate/trans-cinnamate dioxygenase ferredoxin reductase subunit